MPYATLSLFMFMLVGGLAVCCLLSLLVYALYEPFERVVMVFVVLWAVAVVLQILMLPLYVIRPDWLTEFLMAHGIE